MEETCSGHDEGMTIDTEKNKGVGLSVAGYWA